MKIMGYEFVPLDELVNMIEIGKYKKVAVITFDDGFKDLYQNAYPILKEFNIPFTLFLITSLIDSKELLWLHKLYISLDKLHLKESESILKSYSDYASNIEDMSVFIGKVIHSKDKKNIIELMAAMSIAAKIDEGEEKRLARDLYLSSKEIEEMKSNGLTVETHGHEHWPLTNLNEEETEDEIVSSIRFIKEELGGLPKYFSLPYGTTNKYVIDIVKTSGLKGIATIKSQIITESSVDLYNLPRICVYDDIKEIYKIINKYYVKYIYEKLQQ
ncbi:MAG: polysaccharide deacetylase family protein [Deltaproteobacteria bacterium]|nr:polysaccharide deacetylase family protein [Deltaproteobacteria bacterium]